MMLCTELERLRRNHPDDNFVAIHLDDIQESPAEVSRALEENTWVTVLHFRPARHPRDNARWDFPYRVIAARQKPAMVLLFPFLGGDADDEDDDDDEDASSPYLPILNAMQQNQNISKLLIKGVQLRAVDFCTFLDTATHLQELTLDGCEFVEGFPVYRDVVAAFGRNTNIKTLTSRDLRNELLRTIIECLAANMCVAKVVFLPDSLEQVDDGAEEVNIRSGEFDQESFGIYHFNPAS